MKKFRFLAVFVFLFLLAVYAGFSTNFVRAESPTGQSIVDKYDPATPPRGTSTQPLPPDVRDSQNNCDEGKGIDINCTGSAMGYAISGAFVNAVLPISGTNGVASSKDRSFVGFFVNSMNYMIDTPPASSKQYIAYLNDKVNIPPVVAPAYAASGGIGYLGLTPVLKIWEFSRNIAYLCLTIVFIVIAFMIMFRVKIDPKTVATVQNALPKIFLAIILIYFSYAIAGLLIDLMYVLIGVILQVAKQAATGDAVKDIENMSTNLPTETIFGIFGREKFWNVSSSTAAAFNEIVRNLIDSEGRDTTAKIIGFSSSVIAWVIIAGALLIALFKTWFALLNAYIQIVLGVISAPIVLMLEAIPGQSTFSNWIRNMLSNILVFPVTILMILLGSLLSSSWVSSYDVPPEKLFVPPLIGGNSMGAIQGLIGLGLILAMPKAINMLQEFLKAPPFKYGNAWAESLSASSNFARGVAGSGVKKGYEATGIPQTQQLFNQAQNALRAKDLAGTNSVRAFIAKGFGKMPSAQQIENLTHVDSK